MEIFNSFPAANNFGGGGFPSLDEVWDHLLTAGKRIYGIAADDAHEFKGEFSLQRSIPGRAWVVVKARALTAIDIEQSLEAGLFYASTGVALEDIIIKPKAIEILIKQNQDFKYRTEFIGSNGRILCQSESNPAVYSLTKEEKYVRAKVYDSAGFIAWVQPVFITKK